MTLTPSSLYQILLAHFGDQGWWPVDETFHKKNKSDPRFEIIVGAILTQNTAWVNVEKALANLRSHDLLSVQQMQAASIGQLKDMIRPSGYYNQKAQRLHHFIMFIHEQYHDDLDTFFTQEVNKSREELLDMNGIGPETADSILLYAGDQPVFVVDAYTKRIITRVPLKIDDMTYDSIQHYFQTNITNHFPNSEIVSIYKELHALLDKLAKNNCRKKPICSHCPIETQCVFSKQLLQ